MTAHLTQELLGAMRGRAESLAYAEAAYLALGQQTALALNPERRAACERLVDAEQIIQSHATEDIAMLLDWIERAVPLLRKMTWADTEDGEQCQACGRPIECEPQHEPDCQLTAILAGFPEEPAHGR